MFLLYCITLCIVLRVPTYNAKYLVVKNLFIIWAILPIHRLPISLCAVWKRFIDTNFSFFIPAFIYVDEILTNFYAFSLNCCSDLTNNNITNIPAFAFRQFSTLEILWVQISDYIRCYFINAKKAPRSSPHIYFISYYFSSINRSLRRNHLASININAFANSTNLKVLWVLLSFRRRSERGK